MFIESLWFYIVLVIIIGFISFKISAPLIRRWNEFGIKIADQIDKKTNCCYSVLVIEVISILTVIIP